LYTELVARGSQSLAEALKVGGAIEEIDILDLQERLSTTDNADIQQVFNSLLKGSTNHLRAFVSSLQSQTGETYQPQYLNAEAYQALLNGANGGQGGRRGGGGNGQGGHGRGGSDPQP
jgi:rubrerythrin